MNTTSTTFSPDIDVPPGLRTGQPLAARLRRYAWPAVAAIAVAIGAVSGVNHLRFALAHESTDDAQIEGHVSPVLARVGGYVARVMVDDNQRVVAGQPLVEIDAAELDLKVAAAESAWRGAGVAVQSAEAGLNAARAAEAVAVANAGTVRVAAVKAAADLARDVHLHSGGVLSSDELADSQVRADSTAAQLESALKEADAAGARVAVAAAEISNARSQVEGRASELDLARLQRGYATIVAPIDGIVSRKSVEAGQFVPAGQALLSVAADRDLWVVANFKETQLAGMRPGQPVEFTVDGQPGRVFHGHLDSLAGATGARFALLPPDNSTGNFVKVTQRVPVKIVPDPLPETALLRPGMSAVASVRISQESPEMARRDDARHLAKGN